MADRWQDTMAFTVVGVVGPKRVPRQRAPGPGGRPLRAPRVDRVGRCRTVLGGAVAAGGEADFHALEATADLIVGYDSLTGQLLASADGKDRRSVAKDELVDLR